jgi:hypothetical protein
LETEGHFVPQHFSVVDEFDITLTGTGDDEEDCILAIEFIQYIKPDEGEEPSDVSPWNAVACLEVKINVSCKTLSSGSRYKGHNA